MHVNSALYLSLPLTLREAYIFAAEAHGYQKRKYTGEPYINHPVEVASILWNFGIRDTATLIAALLHDVVEDTHIEQWQIEARFGTEAGELVDDLTDSELYMGNRATRKALDRAHSAKAKPKSKTIKCADIISNTSSIVEHDPNFAMVYVREIELLLEVLSDASHPEVYHAAVKCVAAAREQLNHFQSKRRA